MARYIAAGKNECVHRKDLGPPYSGPLCIYAASLFSAIQMRSANIYDEGFHPPHGEEYLMNYSPTHPANTRIPFSLFLRPLSTQPTQIIPDHSAKSSVPFHHPLSLLFIERICICIMADESAHVKRTKLEVFPVSEIQQKPG